MHPLAPVCIGSRRAKPPHITNLTKLASLTCALLASVHLSSCTEVAAEETWFPPAVAEGKADAVDVLLGADIPSQYVNVDKSYIRNRNILHLSDVGAFDNNPIQQDVAERVDGIIANMPANGILEIEELVKMEDPDIFGSLFPEEQSALQELWPYMEAPDNEVVLQLPEFPGEGSVEETLPGHAPLPDSVAIEVLNANYHRSVQRLQLQFNSDNDPATVSLTDLQSGIDDTVGRYTPQDVEYFKNSKQYIAKVRQEVLPGHAVLTLPQLGEVDAEVGAVGAAKILIRGTTHVLEGASYSSSNEETLHSAYLANSVDLRVRTTSADTHVALLTKEQEIIGTPISANMIVRFEERSILEVWENGERKSSAFVVSPAAPPAQVMIDDQIGFRFEDANGDVVERTGDRSGQVRRAWTGIQPAGASQDQLRNYPGFNAAAAHYGRYNMTLASGEELSVEIFEGELGPVVFFYHGGQRLRATYRRSAGTRTSRWVAGLTYEQIFRGTAGIQFTYDPQHRTRHIVTSSNRGRTSEVFTLSGLDRVE